MLNAIAKSQNCKKAFSSQNSNNINWEMQGVERKKKDVLWSKVVSLLQPKQGDSIPFFQQPTVFGEKSLAICTN